MVNLISLIHPLNLPLPRDLKSPFFFLTPLIFISRSLSIPRLLFLLSLVGFISLETRSQISRSLSPWISDLLKPDLSSACFLPVPTTRARHLLLPVARARTEPTQKPLPTQPRKVLSW